MPSFAKVGCILNFILFLVELFNSCVDLIEEVVGGLGLLVCKHLDGCLVV